MLDVIIHAFFSHDINVIYVQGQSAHIRMRSKCVPGLKPNKASPDYGRISIMMHDMSSVLTFELSIVHPVKKVP